eukprot:CAMPEP_0196135598 /NCGR_PEP_ID=MMETSP0910-20130528/4176_1 /TAXON_ID=49265 /ORGANISM="Thalassiosira rotula, Strain GSO102" /LENGTH=950 /DNA_ID=CAMNT_0041395765 /DNA_START=38 /DNA_END=2890 /DNA_ORIENTATION=-
MSSNNVSNEATRASGAARSETAEYSENNDTSMEAESGQMAPSPTPPPSSDAAAVTVQENAHDNEKDDASMEAESGKKAPTTNPYPSSDAAAVTVQENAHESMEVESGKKGPTTNPFTSSNAAAMVLDNSMGVDENNAPVPPAYISAMYDEEMDNVTKTIELNEDNDALPMPGAQISALDEEIGEKTYAVRSQGLSQDNNDVASIMLGDEEDTDLQIQPSTGPVVLDPTYNQIESGPSLPIINGQPPVLPGTAATSPPPPSTSSPPNNDSSLPSDSSAPCARMYEVPEATPVSQEIYDARLVQLGSDTREDDLSTTTGPWWKTHQRFLSLVLVIIIAILAAIMGIGISSNDGTPPEVTDQILPNLTFPPSMAPTECALAISRQVQSLELQEYQMKSPVFAIDGVNGILATGSGSVLFFILSGNKVIVRNLFVYESLGARPSVAISGETAVVGNPHDNVVYVFEQNIMKGLWEEVIDAVALPDDDDGGGVSYFGTSVAVHGNLIVVGAPMGHAMKGSIFIYLRNEDGAWLLQEKIRPESLCSRALFGLNVATHGATVITSAACRQSIYIYHIDTTSGDIISSQDALLDVFIDKSYMANGLYLAVTDLGFPSPINLSSDNYLFLTNATGIMVYQRPSSVESFTFVQYIEVENFGEAYSGYDHLINQSTDSLLNLLITADLIMDYGEGYLFTPAVDKDLFAFASGNLLHVFSQHGGFWEEAIRIESNKFADGNINATLFKGTIAVSGRNLIFVTENSLITYDLEGCTQSTPTMSPSLPQNTSSLLVYPPSTSPTTLQPTISLRPTAVPSLSVPPTSSLVPTAVPSKSQEPTSSAAPTKCYNIEISILLDTVPGETSWDITLVNEDSGEVNGDGLGTVVATSPEYDSNYGFFGGDEYKHSLCLKEGLYEFTIYDSAGNGICCVIIPGYYKVQLDGETIIEGGEFGYEETTTFSLP